jgi:hypothetical protein
MKVGEDVQDGIKHLPGFGRRERPVWKNLPKVLLGTLHYDIYEWFTAKVEASHFIEWNQVRMRQLSGLLPARELDFAIF